MMKNFYLIIVHKENGHVIEYGPFATAQERDDFTCSVWFGQPARGPGFLRGRRVAFESVKQNLYYVTLQNNRMGSIRNVTVGDLAKGASFPKD